MRQTAGDQRGAALALTIVLLLVGGLIIAPVLAHMGTGILAGDVHEEKMDELYAADAGVEHGMWKMITELKAFDLSKCAQGDFNPDPYTFEMDGRTVRVNMEFVTYQGNQGVFKITSEVFALDDAGFTQPLATIVSYIEAYEAPPLDFSGLLDYAIISGGEIELEGGGASAGQVWGDVSLPDEADLKGKEKINGIVYDEVNDGVVVDWPLAEQLRAYYWEQVEDSVVSPYPDGTVIDVSGTTEDNPYVIKASYAEGSLTIEGDGWVRFDGPLYVKGQSSVLSVTANPILNGETMFSEGEIKVMPHTSVYGSGCVIAVGKVYLLPGVHTAPNDYVLVLSLEDEARLLPTVPPGQGDGFYGTVAGMTLVKTLPWVVATWPDQEKMLNFPTGGDAGETSWKSFEVASYTINPVSP